mgnify:CR=1 FL=1
MIYIGALFILIGLHSVSVFNNLVSGLFSIALGALIIYGRYALEKR